MGCEEKQFIIDLLEPFKKDGKYSAEFIKKHIRQVYLKYHINEEGMENKAPKPTDLQSFGVELRKTKNSKIYYIITKLPDDID